MVCNQRPGMIDWLLELGAARVARPVLRGGGGSDATSLPNHIGFVNRSPASPPQHDLQGTTLRRALPRATPLAILAAAYGGAHFLAKRHPESGEGRQWCA